jgi:NAD(P)-dependent dehydrogenase (short-subunit alcohol dehydrogenase family)
MNKKTILITGTSSGIGKATVKYFSDRGWNVAATLRSPDKDSEMKNWPNVKTYALDVTNPSSISAAITATISDFGGIDAIVNNAGYGAEGIFEKATPEQIQKQFDTNVFGVMNVIRGILPHFRQKKGGTIINITSMGGLITFPLYSVYHATKWSVEGFAESLHFELKPLGIRIKNVEPGAIKTDFYGRSKDSFTNTALTDYDAYEKAVMLNIAKAELSAPGPEVVAKTVFKAANSRTYKLRYRAGSQAVWILPLRKMIPLRWFFAIVRMVTEKGFRKK